MKLKKLLSRLDEDVRFYEELSRSLDKIEAQIEQIRKGRNDR